MHEKAKCVCFIHMQVQKMKFKSVQINMKQVSYKSMNNRLYLSHHIKITLKSHFAREKVRFCYYVRNVDVDFIS